MLLDLVFLILDCCRMLIQLLKLFLPCGFPKNILVEVISSGGMRFFLPDNDWPTDRQCCMSKVKKRTSFCLLFFCTEEKIEQHREENNTEKDTQ